MNLEHEARKQQLLQQGKDMGLKKADVTILSRDPYFVGSETDYRDARWAADLWDKMMAKRKKSLHMRGFHYWIQSQGIVKPNGEKYAHKDAFKDWQFLLKATQIARYLEVGAFDNLIDLKHPDPTDHATYWVGSGLSQTGDVDIQEELNSKIEGLVDEFIRSVLSNAPRYHTGGYQLYHCEVWCEKNSMGFVIEPACRKYQGVYQALVGQSSVEKVELCYKRAIRAARAGKRVRVFYIADYDRYGWSMVSAVARKLEFFAEETPDIDIRVCRLALNEDHIEQYNLPKAPKLGEAVVELDALEAIHPGALAKIVEEALKPYFDTEKVKIVEEENRRIRDRARELVEQSLRQPLEEALGGLDLAGIANGFSLEEALDPDFEAPEPGYDVAEDNAWMYNSGLSYWERWSEYKKYKGSREEEEM